MELKDILAVSFATLVTLVIAHLAVFWVVRTLYPPAPTLIAQHVVEPKPVSTEPVKTVTFTEPPVVEQHVDLPTYETALPSKAPREEGEPRRGGPPPPESTSIQREPRVDVPNAQ